MTSGCRCLLPLLRNMCLALIHPFTISRLTECEPYESDGSSSRLAIACRNRCGFATNHSQDKCMPLPQLKVLQPNAKQGTRRRYSSVSGPETNLIFRTH